MFNLDDFIVMAYLENECKAHQNNILIPLRTGFSGEADKIMSHAYTETQVARPLIGHVPLSSWPILIKFFLLEKKSVLPVTGSV